MIEWTILYLIASLGFGWWQLAMDRRYGVQPGASTHPALFVLFSICWPAGVPLAMAAVACGGWGRWPLARS